MEKQRLEKKRSVENKFDISQLSLKDKKIISKTSGLYWKEINKESIFWSNCKFSIKKDIIFNSFDSFKNHRKKNKLINESTQAINISNGILTLKSDNHKLDIEQYFKIKNDKKIRKENSKIPINILIKNLKGCYWKYKDKGCIFWSDDKNNIKKNIIFTSNGQYNRHRFSKYLPENWKGICEIIKKVEEIKKELTINQKKELEKRMTFYTLKNRDLIIKSRNIKGNKYIKQNIIDELIKNNLKRKEIESELNNLNL